MSVGERGKLKLPAHLAAVPDLESPDTAAEIAPKVAPLKPAAVGDYEALSELWDLVVPQLDATGLVSPADGPAIELALRHFLIARVAADELTKGDEPSVTMTDRDGDVRKHPSEAVFRAESEMFLKYANALGMTFVSRARTPAARGGDDGEGNPFSSPVG